DRIGDRKRPLKPKTLDRIRYGLETYGRKPLIITGRYTSGVECRVKDAEREPLPTQPGDVSHAVVFPWLVETSYTQAPDNRVISSSEACLTQTTRQTVGVVGILNKQYGGGAEPTGTITTWDHHAIVALPLAFIAEMRGMSKAAGINEPLMCLTAGGGHHALLSADAFLTYYYGSQNASGITDPIHTMTGIDRAGLVGSLDNLTIEDLTFRMLHPHEIGKAMAFPGEYVVLGTKREMVKQYGNAVTPPVMEMILKRCVASLC
ncbi:MAG TPA: DNA cytosine methyltransferase, partial [Levilinea sp.]|nr:DNA cytosine methyltransferase [Levilinea sp.]